MICVSYTRSRIMFGESIPITEQNEKIAAFVKGRRMTVDKKYSDRKEDVNADEGFLEMKEAGINRQFDCVVFWSMMYFGNDPLVGYNLLLHTFIPAGIDFAVVCDNFFSMGHSAEEIEEYLNGKYKERRQAHGHSIATIAAENRRNTLYGYEKHGDEFIKDKKVEPIVNEIFRLALEGMSVSKICKHFNDAHIDCPQIYLREVVGASTEKAKNEWERMQVKKILTDTRYKGERVVTKKGTVTVKPIEPYITAEEYDKIQTLFRHYEIREKNENPFSKMIFDKDSHIRLYMGDYMSNGTNCFYLSKRTDGYQQYKKKVIAVDAVIDEVKKLLHRERDMARHVCRVLESNSGQAEIAKQKEALQTDINNRLDVLLDTIDAVISLDGETTFGDEIMELDSGFGKLVEQKKRLEKALSSSNPWLDLYANMDDIDELPLAVSQKYICEVLIDRFETVILIPKHVEMKEILPSYWLED